MQKTFTKAALGLMAFLSMSSAADAQITMMKDYQNYSSATIGTYQGISFREAGFSGLYPIPGTEGREFWVCSDRGPNIDAANANPSGCTPTYDKIYAFPTYAPKIHRIKIMGDSIQILRTISIKRPSGSGATGIINPTGFGSTSTEVPSTDTVLNCANFNAKTVAKDIWGIDCEGIVVDKQGNFWLCEEGGPTIWKLDQNGKVVKRYSPYANLVGAEPEDAAIDTVFKYRKNNRGFEGIAIAPNGKIYAIIQSPILYPTKTVGENSRVHRILEIDPATNNMRMFAYLNDGIIGTGSNQIRLRDWKIGDMAAINDSTFLVLEAAARGTTDIKRMYKININGATVVNSGLYNGKTLEELVDSTGLAGQSIVAVKKTMVMDLLANGWPASLDKAEGLAIINDSTIAICNDNDYAQYSPNEDGIVVASGKTSHLVTYSLKGSSKLANFSFLNTTLSLGVTGLYSSQAPYLVPAQPNVKFTSLLTTGDKVGAYTMCGTPDGTGSFDNGNGTFTVVFNHEFGNTSGNVRAHGNKGAFISKWIINKSDLSFVSGSDLMQNIYLWNTATQSYVAYNSSFNSASAAFARFCSADLPAATAFYNSFTGKGTQERIFMNGEENGSEGRGMAHIITGPNGGNSYELPALGKFSWENSVANPMESDKTIVVGTDDATPGQVYVYIGTKTNSGNEIEKAGLTNGKLYGIKVNGMTTEVNGSVPAPNTPFTLVDLGNVTNITGATLNTISNNNGVTSLLRPEDAAWDPSNPTDLYVATTNGFNSNSRLWQFRFSNANDFTQGGTATAVLDGSEGQQMLDNMGIDNSGHILLVEDVGGNSHIGKTWQYTIATDDLKQVAAHDSTRFLNGSANFLTQDEEASGIVDAQEALGAGMWLIVDQAHYSQPGELVEGGQFLAMFNPDTYNNNPEIAVKGNSNLINDGDVTPAATDFTDFENVNVGNNFDRTFVIENAGPGALRVSGINITGANAANFTVVSPSTFPVTVPAKGTQNIVVKFTPTALAAHTATVNIMNNDYSEGRYNFDVKGTGTTPEIAVKGNNLVIADGDVTPGTANNTDFGVVKVGTKMSKTFDIQNSGNGVLTVSEIKFTGANAPAFSLVNAPAFPLSIASNATQSFSVEFAPLAMGTHVATINIKSDDIDEDTYDFAVKGESPDPSNVASANGALSAIKLFPNPTENMATVALTLAADEQVSVKLFDINGKEVLEAVNKKLKAGEQQINFSTASLVSGTYFVKVTSGATSMKMKLVVMH
jgi:hypothetical protein